MAKRPYSTQYTARANPRNYYLSGIPPTLWDTVRTRARREHVALRSLILSLLETWLKRPDHGVAPAQEWPLRTLERLLQEGPEDRVRKEWQEEALAALTRLRHEGTEPPAGDAVALLEGGPDNL